MICAHPGHLTQRPSGTRLGFSAVADAIGFRAFLNHAIRPTLARSKARAGRPLPPSSARSTACPLHRPDLPDQIVERLVARLQVDLRRLDDEQRRGRVVEEEVLVGLVQLAEVVVGGDRARRGSGSLGALAQAAGQHVGRRLQVDDEVGRGNVLGEQVEEPLVDEQLVVVEVQVREDLVLSNR